MHLIRAKAAEIDGCHRRFIISVLSKQSVAFEKVFVDLIQVYVIRIKPLAAAPFPHRSVLRVRDIFHGFEKFIKAR